MAMPAEGLARTGEGGPAETNTRERRGPCRPSSLPLPSKGVPLGLSRWPGRSVRRHAPSAPLIRRPSDFHPPSLGWQTRRTFPPPPPQSAIPSPIPFLGVGTALLARRSPPWKPAIMGPRWARAERLFAPPSSLPAVTEANTASPVRPLPTGSSPPKASSRPPKSHQRLPPPVQCEKVSSMHRKNPYSMTRREYQSLL